jgi:hypothetical protein
LDGAVIDIPKRTDNSLERELERRKIYSCGETSELSEPFCFFSSDQLADGDFRTISSELGKVGSPNERDRFFHGFHRSMVSFAEARNDLIVEHIVKEKRWEE